MATLVKDARVLADYLSEMRFQDFVYRPPSPYNHMGAFLTDIVLQPGLNYNTVVRPRVARVFRIFPKASTISVLEKEVQSHGAMFILNWKHAMKIDRFHGLVSFCKNWQIESEKDLQAYLRTQEGEQLFRSIDGIGPKTYDYSLKLLGVDAVAVDRHIYSFVQAAGIKKSEYKEVKKIVEFAADLLNSPRRKVDTFIWSYMSKALAPEVSLFDLE